MGLCPSESTFYSSESYATFTEEAAIRNDQSFGWTFIDSIKPRLYKPLDTNGIGSILSRINRIGNTCKYLHDENQILRICETVDFMIESCPVIRDRTRRYNLVPAFPPAFGGLGHPIRFISGFEFDIPLEDRASLVRLAFCSDEQFFNIKYSWALENLQNEDAQYLRSVITRMYHLYCSLPEGLSTDVYIHSMHTYTDEIILSKEGAPSFSAYQRDLALVKRELGLASLDDMIIHVSSAMRLRLELEEAGEQELNPMIQLRNRREFLISKTQGLPGEGHDFSWRTLELVSYRSQSSYHGTNVLMEDFLDMLDLSDLTSLSIPVNLTIGGP
jgi:hypothetical protein